MLTQHTKINNFLLLLIFLILLLANRLKVKKNIAVPLHAMQAHGRKGGIAPTHT
jgi:hypothetical protein